MRDNFKANETPISFTYGVQTYDLRNRQARVTVAGLISDDYAWHHAEFNHTVKAAYYSGGGGGEGPVTVPVDSALLDRLSDILLYEELTDTSKNKMTREEYPIMSEHQENRRRDSEYAEVLADSYDSNGVNQAKPERRHRTERDNRFVEKEARTKNRARKAQYLKDTSPGAVVTYNLYDTGGVLSDEFVDCSGLGKRWFDEMSAVNETEIIPGNNEEKAAA